MDARRDTGRVVDVVIAGDFNRHDQLWEGGDVSLERRGESEQIIDLMNEFALSSLLRPCTKTWQGGGHESTIDLVLASTINCALHGTENGSDHRAIETVLDISVPVPKHQERLLLKNASWKGINARIARIGDYPVGGHSVAEYGQTYVCGIGGGPRHDAQSQTIAIRKAVVDFRPHAAPSHIHVLEEPCQSRETRRADMHKARGHSERSSHARERSPLPPISFFVGLAPTCLEQIKRFARRGGLDLRAHHISGIP